jgi:HK97 family phage major capsid protein
MNYKKLAEAALEKRAALISEIRSVNDSTTLSATAKAETVSRLNRDISAAEAEARTYVEEGEREAEFRALAANAGALMAVPNRHENRDGAWLAHEVRQVLGTGGLGAATTPPEHANFWFDRMAPASAFLASGVNVLRTDKDSLVVPRLLADPVATWTAEGAEIVAGDPSGDSVTATPRKIATRTEVSNEVLADSEPKALAIVEKSLLRSVALAFDLGAFEGTGTSNQIQGLKNTPGIGAISLGANGAALTDLDAFADALGLLSEANAEGRAIVMHPRTWRGLTKVKEDGTSTRPLLSEAATSPSGAMERRLYGVPVYLTSALSVTETQGTSTDCSSIYVYDPTQLFAVLRKEAEVAIDPYSLFSKDMSQVRVISRADIVVANAAAVVRIAGVKP